MLQGQPDVLALLVSSTTTQTVTSSVTLTGSGERTEYRTFTQVSSIQRTTRTTYTTTGFTTVAARILTTELVPVVVVTQTAGSSCKPVQCPAPGNCPPPPPGSCIMWAKVISVTNIVPTVGWVMVQTRSRIVDAVTNQLVTNVPKTLVSTSASTSTYSTGQVAAITATQTFTSVSEQAGPSISDMLFQNLWIILALGVAVLGALAFKFGRGGGTGPSGVDMPNPPTPPVQGAQSGIVYCLKCGTQNPATNEFCGKCGTKLG